MEKPISITNEKINGRDAVVARMPNGLIKIIYADGECVFAIDEKLRSPKNPAPEKTDA